MIPLILHAPLVDGGEPRQYRVPVCFVMGGLDNWYVSERDGIDEANVVDVADYGFSDFKSLHVVYSVDICVYFVNGLKLSRICALDTYLLSEATILWIADMGND